MHVFPKRRHCEEPLLDKTGLQLKIKQHHDSVGSLLSVYSIGVNFSSRFFLITEGIVSLVF